MLSLGNNSISLEGLKLIHIQIVILFFVFWGSTFAWSQDFVFVSVPYGPIREMPKKNSMIIDVASCGEKLQLDSATKGDWVVLKKKSQKAYIRGVLVSSKRPSCLSQNFSPFWKKLKVDDKTAEQWSQMEEFLERGGAKQ